MWAIETRWFDVAVVTSLFAAGNILFGHFEQHKPPWRRLLKVAIVLAVVLTVAQNAGRSWAYGILALPLPAVVYIHFWWLPKHGINGWTGEPRDKYLALLTQVRNRGSMWRSWVGLFVVAAAASVTSAALDQPTGEPGNDLPQPYRTTRDWGQLPPGVKWAAVTAIEPAPDGSIYVIHRCFANSCAGRKEAPILKYDATGTLLKSWGDGMFIFPHGATVDRDANLWITDARGENGKGHQVFKFSPDGRVLMTLGKAGVPGSTPDVFDQPTDVVVAPNGDVFVTDSHRNGKNNRVVKFNKDGKYIKEWGTKGSGRGKMSEPHTIAMDSRGRLFVGDRENNRIVIYDQDGKVIEEWRQFGRPSGIFITKDDTIYVADSESGPDTGAHELTGIKKGIRIGSAKDGKVVAFIEDSESTTPDHSGAEGVGVDAQGNVYGAVVRRQMLERHVRTRP